MPRRHVTDGHHACGKVRVMKMEIRQHPLHGRILFMSDAHVEVGAALDFGIRIVHLCVPGMENLMYEQPEDLSDGLSTAEGWRIRGGHRLWPAPESDRIYCPDNDPVAYELLPEGFVLRQKTEDWTGMQKTISVERCEGGALRVTHTLTYEGEGEVQAAAWGVTTLKGGGSAVYPFPAAGGVSEYSANRVLALWGDTSLADDRLSFSGNEIRAQHKKRNAYFKIGIYSAAGCIGMTNLGQSLEIRFDVLPMDVYTADRGCNAELYLNPDVMELETLGKTAALKKGESVSHVEYWRVSRQDIAQ